MAYIIESPNPFQPLKDLKRHVHEGGISIRGWLETTYPGFTEFQVPTICVVNGQPVLRKDWDRPIEKDDVVTFMAVAGDPVSIIIAVVIAIIAIVLAMTVFAPETPGEPPSSDPVYSTKGQTNSIRLGEPIEVNYGRNRIYPSLASRPFFRYINNDQFQHSLFCIGQGEYEIEQILIGDTDINSYQEVEYEIIPPHGVPSLFTTNVVTSADAGGQTLFGPNEEDYPTPDGWVGPFSANPAGTETDRLEVDITFPAGLFRTDSKGKVRSVTVTFEIQAREIDGVGAPIGPWTTIINPTVTMKSTTPQRLTYSADVAAGRYEVRARRTSIKNLSTRYHSDVVWEALRAYIVIQTDEIIDFGEVTLLAVKIRATSNLNARTQERFNVICTRKLPIRESGSGWSEPVATRSIVWAFVDVFRSQYGGRIVDDNYFDWEALEELEDLYEYRNEHFDWTFRDPITLWEAAKAIARAGRAIPLLVGSLITMKRDGPLEVPVAMFSHENIIKGTFSWDIKLWEPYEHDSIAAEYTEPDTGYKQEQVIAVLPDSDATTNSPKDVRFPGIQDRNHAYREALYLLASERYLRENISFETGMEGFIPSFGELIAVSHDAPQWGQAGYILAVEERSGGDWILWVSEPLTFEESNTYQVFLRKKDGSLLGPIDATETDDPKKIIINLSTEVDFLTGGTTEPMLFLFGVTGSITKYCRVVKIEPQGGERVKITAVNEEPIIHSFDSLTAPPLATVSFPPVVPDLPIVTALYLSQVDDLNIIVQASWPAAFGAQSYIVQTSEDGTNWENRATTTRTSIQLQGRTGTYWVRVAAINEGQGPWVEETIDLGIIFGLDNYLPWDGLEWGVRWWSDLNVESYVIRVYDNSGVSPVLKRTDEQTGVEYLYDYFMAVADGNLSRAHRVTVDAKVLNEDTGVAEETGFPAGMNLFNAIPDAPYGEGWELIGPDSPFDSFTFRFFWDATLEDDVVRVKLWASTTQGFDPNVVSPVYDQTFSPGMVPDEVFLQLAMVGVTFPNYYWRVAFFDLWGNEISTNITDEDAVFLPWILAGAVWDDEGRWEDTDFWNDS